MPLAALLEPDVLGVLQGPGVRPADDALAVRARVPLAFDRRAARAVDLVPERLGLEPRRAIGGRGDRDREADVVLVATQAIDLGDLDVERGAELRLKDDSVEVAVGGRRIGDHSPLALAQGVYRLRVGLLFVVPHHVRRVLDLGRVELDRARGELGDWDLALVAHLLGSRY